MGIGKKVAIGIPVGFVIFIIIGGSQAMFQPQPEPFTIELDEETYEMLKKYGEPPPPLHEPSSDSIISPKLQERIDLYHNQAQCEFGYFETPIGCCPNDSYYDPSNRECYYHQKLKSPDFREFYHDISNENSGGSSSGSFCGGMGSVYVTKPIWIAEGVVFIGNSGAGILERAIPSLAGTYTVKVQAITTSGNLETKSWNVSVTDCKQSLIKWN